MSSCCFFFVQELFCCEKLSKSSNFFRFVSVLKLVQFIGWILSLVLDNFHQRLLIFVICLILECVNLFVAWAASNSFAQLSKYLKTMNSTLKNSLELKNVNSNQLLYDLQDNILRWNHRPHKLDALKISVMRECAKTELLFELVQASLNALLKKIQEVEIKRQHWIRYIFHEVRTPLHNTTIGIAQLEIFFGCGLSNEHSEPALTRKQREQLEIIQLISIQCGDMSRILNDVLLLQKMENHNLEINCASFSIATLINHTLELHQMSAANKQVQFVSKCQSIHEFLQNLCPTATLMKYNIIADRHRLRQVLSNLLTNAIKFSNTSSKIEIEMHLEEIENEKVTGSPHNLLKYRAAQLQLSEIDTRPLSFINPKNQSLFLPYISTKIASHEVQARLLGLTNSAVVKDGITRKLNVSEAVLDGDTLTTVIPRDADLESVLVEKVQEESLQSSMVRCAIPEQVRLIISVRDFGVGISVEQQKKLFQPFMQFDPDKLQNGGGSGLGLNIAHEIMNAHGGKLVYKTPNDGLGGSIFELSLNVNIQIRPLAEAKSLDPHRYRNSHGMSKNSYEEYLNNNINAETPGNRERATIDPFHLIVRDLDNYDDEKPPSVECLGVQNDMIRMESAPQLTVNPDISNEISEVITPPSSHYRHLKGNSSKFSILIVDDSAVARKLNRKLLESMNYLIDEAENGQVCLNKVIGEVRNQNENLADQLPNILPSLKKHPPQVKNLHSYDLILMDGAMPVMDGYTACELLRKTYFVQTPIVALTGNATQSDIDRFLACGANLVLTKPCSVKKFSNTLHQFLKPS